jgi:hypothetical protein
MKERITQRAFFARPQSPARILVLHTREDLAIAREAPRLVGER